MLVGSSMQGWWQGLSCPHFATAVSPVPDGCKGPMASGLFSLCGWDEQPWASNPVGL